MIHTAPEPRLLRWLPWLLLLLYIWILLRTSWLCDDAYISFRYIENLLGGYGLRFNVQERVQGFSNPLWLFWNIPLRLLTGEMFFSAHLTAILTSVAAMAVLLWNRAVPVVQRCLAALLLCICPAFVDYSTSGLENPLNHLLLALAFRELCFREQPRLSYLSLFTSLLMVNRMDAVLFLAPALGYYAWEYAGRSLHPRAWLPLMKPLLAGMTPFLLWEIFAVMYYGFPLPNTAYAKLGTGISLGQYLQQGRFYFEDGLVFNWPLMALLPIILYGIWRQGDRAARLLGTGLLLYAVYVLRIGGDFMSGRFFSGIFFLGALLLTRLRLPASPALLPACWVASITLLVVWRQSPLMLPQQYGPRTVPAVFREHGIADERAFYYYGTGLMQWALMDTTPAMLPCHNFMFWSWPRSPGVIEHGLGTNMGMMGFRGGPWYHYIDLVGLTDPWLARMDAMYNPGWRIGHQERRVPPAYLESVRTGKNQFTEPEMRQDYDDLQAITRGDLFSAARWRAILRLNLRGGRLGDYRHRYRIPVTDTLTVQDLQVRLSGTAASPGEVQGLSLEGVHGLALRRSGPEPVHIRIQVKAGDNAVFTAVRAGEPCWGILISGRENAGPGIYEVNFGLPAQAAGADMYCLYPAGADPVHLLQYEEEY